MTGGPFRLIHGGRSEEPTPGLLIVGASEVVTLAGGVRMGARQGDVERLSEVSLYKLVEFAWNAISEVAIKK
jgi:hypothetical protein